MAEWYYGKSGQQFGPIDEATLRARLATGEISSRDMVWTLGMSEWRPYFEVAHLLNQEPKVGESEELVEVKNDSPYAPPSASAIGGIAAMPSMPRTSGLAIASLVCGILSLLFFCLCGGVFFGIPAVVCGHLGLNQIGSPGNVQKGRGLAIAGLVCGYLGLVVFVLMMIGSEWF